MIKVDSYGNSQVVIVVAIAILIPRWFVIVPMAKLKKFNTVVLYEDNSIEFYFLQ